MARRASNAWCLIVLALSALPIHAGGIAIVGTDLVDDGDHDGFADTAETIELRLLIENTTDAVQHDLELELSTYAPEIACIGRSRVAAGDLQPGEQRWTTDGFVFTVGNVDRRTLGLGPLDELSASFEIRVRSDQLDGYARARVLTFDLDFDASGGAGPTTFFESFESGTLGSFTIQNLDQGRHSFAESDGYRCQYHDPDWIYSSSYGSSQATDCFLGNTPEHLDATFWQVDRAPSRAFSGNTSLYYGVETMPVQTTPVSVLEAVATTDPIHIGRYRACEGDGTTVCMSELDCPPAERCLDRPAQLTFKHQVRFAFRRDDPDTAFDRGVVQARLADALGHPVGPWIKLYPFRNPYESQGEQQLSSCTFDPVDDGNTEDDFFDPTDPWRRLGPSSTCNPERAFALVGDTRLPFDPTHVGFAEGPGLAGQSGTGTWVESSVDLSRFRGHSLRIRFLSASIKIGGPGRLTWAQNARAGEEGWWIDDIAISHAQVKPARLELDDRPGDALPGGRDADGDGLADACDLCPASPGVGSADRDADGVGDPCDVCPDDFDPDQADSDSDSVGDACDRCANGDAQDADEDGLLCALDSCPLLANRLEQRDTDGDGEGDICDGCPRDVANDEDGDGICSDVDRCPTSPNVGGLPGLRLSSDHGRGRPVDPYEVSVSPDGRTVVYSVQLPDRIELYSVPVSGAEPARLTAAPRPATDVEAVRGYWCTWCGDPNPESRISPDSRTVVFRADVDQNLSLEMYAAPLSGGVDPVLLAFWGRPLGISPDSRTLIFDYRVDQPGSARDFSPDGMFAMPLSGGPAVNLTNSPGSGTVLAFTPDGALAIYRNGSALYSVPLSGASPPVQLNDWATPVASGQLSDDGRYFVFESGGKLYSVRVDGGAPTLLNGALAPGSVVNQNFVFGPEGSVVYLANEARSGPGIYRASITGAGSARIAPLSVVPAPWRPFIGSRDRQHVVYIIDEGDLFSLRVTGGPPVRLGKASYAEISPDSARVVYRSELGLYGVSIRGGPPVRLDVALPPEGTIGDFGISRDGSTVAFQSRAGARWLYSVPIVGGDPELLDGPLAQLGLLGIAESAVVYYAAREGEDSLALYSAPLPPDADGDGIDRFCDSCPTAFNPDPSASTDFDDDGLDCAHDNCPLVANALQDDADGDGIGDACDSCPAYPFPDVDGDGTCSDVDNCMRANPYQRDDDHDGLGNLCDICPFDHDPGQEDADRDGLGDACDCAPADPEVRWPAEVENVRASREPGMELHLDWDAAAGADNYSISRGSLSALDANQYGGCLVEGLAETAFVDAALPAPDQGFFYNVIGSSSRCRLGSPGFDSREFARWNTDAAACDGVP